MMRMMTGLRGKKKLNDKTIAVGIKQEHFNLLGNPKKERTGGRPDLEKWAKKGGQ